MTFFLVGILDRIVTTAKNLLGIFKEENIEEMQYLKNPSILSLFYLYHHKGPFLQISFIDLGGSQGRFLSHHLHSALDQS